jgi:predicted RNase H-like HicB family nuclease
MKNQFTAYVQRDGEWFVATCPEVPEANGQGTTRDEALHSLAEAIELVFEERRSSARIEVSAGTEETSVAVG